MENVIQYKDHLIEIFTTAAMITKDGQFIKMVASDAKRMAGGEIVPIHNQLEKAKNRIDQNNFQ